MTKRWRCTCQSQPSVYDITNTLNGTKECDVPSTCNSQLYNSLSHYGWTYLSVHLDQLESPSSSSSPLHSLRDVKPQLLKLFEGDYVSTNSSVGPAIYRGRSAESGSSAERLAEPKQSWELSRKHASATAGSNSSDGCLSVVSSWVQALHTVAVAVTRELDLPRNVLLEEEEEESGCSTESVDLLRVFLYDPVEEEEEEEERKEEPTANTTTTTTTTTTKRLGSSPHTDWGSWTVVWQDQLGGLQTHCPVHEKYVAVQPLPLERNTVHLVVHVGDVTSLVWNHAANNDSTCVEFPSPRHRVVCPTNDEPRASLVYFCYPPSDTTLSDMENELSTWGKGKEDTGRELDYAAYYLLHNQSTNGESADPKKVYQEIRSKPLKQVFADKWAQVQRG